MSELGKTVDAVVSAAVAERLKAQGFRKSGRTWRRRVDDCIQVINVAFSSRKDEGDAEVTLYAGLYYRAVADRIPFFTHTDTPALDHCQLRLKAMPPGVGYWKIRAAGVAKTDPEVGRLLGAIFSWLDRRADRKAPKTNARVFKALRESVETRALPWLNATTTMRAARDQFILENQWWEAVSASLELGDRDSAVRMLQTMIKKAGSDSHDLVEWGRTNGIHP